MNQAVGEELKYLVEVATVQPLSAAQKLADAIRHSGGNPEQKKRLHEAVRGLVHDVIVQVDSAIEEANEDQP